MIVALQSICVCAIKSPAGLNDIEARPSRAWAQHASLIFCVDMAPNAGRIYYSFVLAMCDSQYAMAISSIIPG